VGKPAGSTVLHIVSPDTREDQGEGRVGEIWLDGPCKALGYFADEEKTRKAFHGVIQGDDDHHIYLQTGEESSGASTFISKCIVVLDHYGAI